MGIEEMRVRYEHDANCSEKNWYLKPDSELKQCMDCSGVFDKNGKGVFTTDKRFDSWRPEAPQSE